MMVPLSFSKWPLPRTDVGRTLTVLVGDPGAGKTQALVSLMDTVQRKALGVVAAGASAGLLKQYDATVSGQPTVRSPGRFQVEALPPGAEEVLRLSEIARRHVIEAWAGEDKRDRGAIDQPVLLQRLRDYGVQ